MSALRAVAVYFLIVQVNQAAEGSATFEWLLVSFNNPSGTEASGQKCDFFAGDCDHVFRFGLDYLTGSDSASETPILTKVTQSFDNENINRFPSDAFVKGVQNPIIKAFDSWPGGLLLKVHVEDDDSPLKGPEFVDDIVYRLIAGPAASRRTSAPLQAQASGKRTMLSFTWRVYCDDGYYGSNCTKLCRGSDDQLNGRYTCDSFGNKVCLPGWDDVSRNCLVKLDDCGSNRCENGATCVNVDRSYRCQCTPGYTGKHCEINIDECLPNPCQNGATCLDGINDYVCKCLPEFVGKNCSVNACTEQSPCLNGGTCYGDRNCYCSLNFVGAKCQDPMCKLAGCLNGGICTVNGSCLCRPGFEGMRCELDLCSTIAPLCQNGGVCRDGKCECTTGFAGKTCQENTLCNSITCGLGTCVVVQLKNSQILQPECQCPEGYSGNKCQTKSQATSGESLTSGYVPPSSSLSVFTVLFIVFVVLTIISIVIIIVLSVLLYKKTTNRVLKSVEARSSISSEVYSTVSQSFGETIKSHKLPAIPNQYEGMEVQNSSPEYDFAKKTLDEVCISDIDV